jgi:hypothetical protein
VRRVIVPAIVVSLAVLIAVGCGGGTKSTPSPTSTPSRVDLALQGAHELDVSVRSWAIDHGNRYPPASGITAAVLWKDTDTDGPWPTNPWTSRPMAQGTGPGDFTYTVAPSRRHAKLVLHGENGQSLRTITFAE